MMDTTTRAAVDGAYARYEARWRALRDDLTPELRDRVAAVISERAAAEQHAAEQQIAEIARHFPGLAPALRAVAAHVLEQSGDEDSACCADA